MTNKSRVEVLPSRGIIMVRNCTVDYDLIPTLRVLPCGNKLIASSYDPACWLYDSACWNGWKSGTVEGANIPLFFPRRVLSTAEGRQGLAVRHAEYGVPADLVPLVKDKEVRQGLGGMGIRWVAAFDKDDEALWIDRVFGRSVVYFDLTMGYLGFHVSLARTNWPDDTAVVGAPQ